MGNYEELDIRLQKAHERVLRSQGQEAFGEMLARLPLSPCDEAVEVIAKEHGWDETFMTTSRASLPIAVTRLRPPVNNRQVPDMFAVSQSKAPPSRRPAGVAAPNHGGEAPPMAPPRVVPGPRAVPPPPPNAAAVRPEAAAMPEAQAPVPLPAPVAAEQEPAEGMAPEVVAEDRPICAICQDFMNGPEGGEVEAFPCGHAFHAVCIAQWKRHANLVGQLRCPTCRRPVPADNDEVDNDEVDMGQQDLPAGDGTANGEAAAVNNVMDNVEPAQEVVA